jgi:cysteine desulfurase
VRAAIDRAREQVAQLLGSEEDEILFTSGGTEANNAALAGVFFAREPGRTAHILVSSVEHPSVAATCDFLARLGAVVTRIPVDRCGRVDPGEVRRLLRPETALISVMHANNELGTLQPIREIAAIARERGVLVHCDAAQSAGKIPVEVAELGVDLLSVAGHKMYAPAGVGVLYIRRGVRLEPFLHGAGHEQGRRAGTENVLEIAGLGAACQLAHRWIGDTSIRDLRDTFWRRLSETFGDRVVLNGHPTERLPNTLHVSFPGHHGEEILAQIPWLAASTGSACHAGSHHVSPVLAALGLPEAVAFGAIRFSLGRTSTRQEVDAVVEELVKIVGPR